MPALCPDCKAQVRHVEAAVVYEPEAKVVTFLAYCAARCGWDRRTTHRYEDDSVKSA